MTESERLMRGESMTTENKSLKITMGSVRLTGDQTERLMTIYRSKVVECYEHWDWRLRDLGLVVIGPIPAALKRSKEKWIAAALVKVRKMVSVKNPTLAKIREMEGLLNQINHAAYRLDKKYSTLTNAGQALAASGRVVILPRDVPVDKGL